jgi:hypothetical protein
MRDVANRESPPRLPDLRLAPWRTGPLLKTTVYCKVWADELSAPAPALMLYRLSLR